MMMMMMKGKCNVLLDTHSLEKRKKRKWGWDDDEKWKIDSEIWWLNTSIPPQTNPCSLHKHSYTHTLSQTEIETQQAQKVAHQYKQKC